MAVVVLGGLVTSTLLNLFVVPALYLRFGAASEPDSRLRRRAVVDLDRLERSGAGTPRIRARSAIGEIEMQTRTIDGSHGSWSSRACCSPAAGRWPRGRGRPGAEPATIERSRGRIWSRSRSPRRRPSGSTSQPRVAIGRREGPARRSSPTPRSIYDAERRDVGLHQPRAAARSCAQPDHRRPHRRRAGVPAGGPAAGHRGRDRGRGRAVRRRDRGRWNAVTERGTAAGHDELDRRIEPASSASSWSRSPRR